MYQTKKMKFLKFSILLLFLAFTSCKQSKKETSIQNEVAVAEKTDIKYAKGFQVEKLASGITKITITAPWPDAENAFTYALVPKEKEASITLNKDEYDAIVSVPVERIIVTSTTHIPALEALNVEDKLIGFPNTDFISSPKTRKNIDAEKVKELGANESINTEMVIAMNPDVVIGFGIDGNNKTYNTLQRSNINVVYNGDWMEESPLGKAEWIKFFAPFFNAEAKADEVFNEIEASYNQTMQLAQEAKHSPTVLTGGLFNDVWHVAGGKSWMAQFLKDANANYLWAENQETGGVGLGLETVFAKGGKADFWISPSNSSTYAELRSKSEHYAQFDAFKNKKIYTNTLSKGETGGLLFFELAPNRPDLVLQDLIHIFHPDLLPEHKPVFFKPLQ